MNASQELMAQRLREIILEMDTTITERRSFNLPFFYRKKWLCYLNPKKDGRFEVGFCNGQHFADPTGRMIYEGRKLIGSVMFSSPEELEEQLDDFRVILHEAIMYDRSL